MLKDYFTYDDIREMPIKNLMDWIEFHKPKMAEIAKRQAQERMKAELENKKRAQSQRRAEQQRQQRHGRR